MRFHNQCDNSLTGRGFATVTNPAIFALLCLLLVGYQRDYKWTVLIGPLITWAVLGAFLVLAVIVRVIQWVRYGS